MVTALAGCTLCLVSLANAQQLTRRPQSRVSGTWQRTATNPPGAVGVPILLTDGTILCHSPLSRNWYKLTPTADGNYQNGTWSTMASMQTGYGPLYYASSVLADGRVVVIGGEYNLDQGGVWTNKGAIYNPVTDSWTVLPAPSGWNNVGDAQCQVMPDGTFMLCHIDDTQMALLDPTTMQWTARSGAGKMDRFDEEGWVLLADGTIITTDAINAPHAEKYIPWLDRWVSAGDTPDSLEDPGSQEIGPMVMTPDGKVFCFGATGHNAIYTPGASPTDPGSWVRAPDFPNIGGQLDIADGPAVLLPNGRILSYASPGVFNAPSHFYEWDGSALLEVANVPNSSSNPSFVGNFLILPNGQILFTDLSSDVEIYTPANNIPNEAWRPTITASPASVQKGLTYQITGTQFNGLSNGSGYGDDSTNNSNYPLVRIRNTATGHVFYCRTHDHSTMGVATGSAQVFTNFDVPDSLELGPSVVEVVCNGISSAPKPINVHPQVQASKVKVFTGVTPLGQLSDIWFVDDLIYSVNSITGTAGQDAAIEADFNLPSSDLSGIRVSAWATAPNTATGSLYIYDWTTKTFEFLGNTNFKVAKTSLSGKGTQPGSHYIGPKGKVRVVLRALIPARLRKNSFKLRADSIEISSS
jgi:hypothetical protein